LLTNDRYSSFVRYARESVIDTLKKKKIKYICAQEKFARPFFKRS